MPFHCDWAATVIWISGAWPADEQTTLQIADAPAQVQAREIEIEPLLGMFGQALPTTDWEA